MTAKPKRPSPVERLQAKLLAVLEERPGSTTLHVQDLLLRRQEAITDGRGKPIIDHKIARERIAQVLGALRDKQRVFDRQNKGVTYWYPATYRQGPKLQPSLGPTAPRPGVDAPPAPRPAPHPAAAPAHHTYTITLEPDRAALTAQALFRLASLLAPDISALLHPLVEMLNPQTDEEDARP